MAAEPEIKIPVLTDELGDDADPIESAYAVEREALIAELQTQIAASTFALTDEIMRKAFAEMEATIFEQISGRLRRDLPDMVDALLRERLGRATDY